MKFLLYFKFNLIENLTTYNCSYGGRLHFHFSPDVNTEVLYVPKEYFTNTTVKMTFIMEALTLRR